MGKFIIKNGKVFNSEKLKFEKADVMINGKVIEKVEKSLNNIDGYEEIDAEGKILSPGFIDLHAHLRDPGETYKEDIISGTKAAAKGGFTTICCMPNTKPVIDELSVVEYINKKAVSDGVVKVRPIGRITKGDKKDELAEIGLMYQEGGIVGISNDGSSVSSAKLMRNGLIYAKKYDIPVMCHCEDKDLSEGGQIHDGYYSTKLGFQGIPSSAESIIVGRDLLLGLEVGSRVHIAHVSAKESIALIEDAKKKSNKITCEVTPHHLCFDDSEYVGFDTNYKVNPPLRSSDDRKVLIDALNNDTIDAIATDHAPHADYEKEVEFDRAPFGINGFETAFASLNTFLVKNKEVKLEKILEKLTIGPAKVIGLKDVAILKEGYSADLCIIDLEKEWEVTAGDLKSKSKNTPLMGKNLVGRVITTIVNGEIVWSE